ECYHYPCTYVAARASPGGKPSMRSDWMRRLAALALLPALIVACGGQIEPAVQPATGSQPAATAQLAAITPAAAPTITAAPTAAAPTTAAAPPTMSGLITTPASQAAPALQEYPVPQGSGPH